MAGLTPISPIIEVVPAVEIPDFDRIVKLPAVPRGTGARTVVVIFVGEVVVGVVVGVVVIVVAGVVIVVVVIGMVVIVVAGVVVVVVIGMVVIVVAGVVVVVIGMMVIVVAGVVVVAAVPAAFNTHQPGELFRIPVRVAPTVRRFGKSVVEAATHTC